MTTQTDCYVCDHPLADHFENRCSTRPCSCGVPLDELVPATAPTLDQILAVNAAVGIPDPLPANRRPEGGAVHRYLVDVSGHGWTQGQIAHVVELAQAPVARLLESARNVAANLEAELALHALPIVEVVDRAYRAGREAAAADVEALPTFGNELLENFQSSAARVARGEL